MDGFIATGVPDAPRHREEDEYVLPAPVPPEPDESLPSLILRNAGVYGFRAPMRLLSRIETPITSLAALAFVDPASEFGGGLARLLGITRDRLARMVYGTADPKACSFLGHRLHHDLISLDDRRYCPLCLRASPHHRAIWDLSVVTVCLEHGVRLLTRCPGSHRVNWRTDHVHLCARYECRRDLREASAEEVPAAELAGARGLIALFRDHRPPDLAPLSPGDALRAAFHLGAVALGHHNSPRPILFARKRPEETVRVLNAGWSALQDWPHGFHRLLARLRADQEARDGRYGLGKAFGFLTYWLRDAAAAEPYGVLLGGEFYRYVAEQPDLATRAHEVRRFRSGAGLRHRHMTGRATAELLGIRYDRLAALAVERDLYLVPPTGKGAASLMRADRVHALLRERSSLLSGADVQRRLGVGKRTMNKLRSAGLLTTVMDPDAPGGVRYPVASVDGLLREIEARVPQDGLKLRDGVSIVTVTRRVPVPGFDTTDVIEAIRAGSLTPAGVTRGSRGIRRFRFRSSDVDRFVMALTRAEGRTLSVVEAAVELGVKQEVAYHWVRTGLLATVTVDSPTETGRRITETALAAFRKGYVTGTEFARAHQLGRMWAATHLIQMGVQAVSGPSVDGARQFLFRRADLQGLDPKRLVSGQSKLQPQVARSRRLDRAGSEGFKYAVGKALKREFGEDLVRRYHCYQQASTGTVIQVMTASNMGMAGTYKFLLSTNHRTQLAAAEQGFLALGFADREDFLLVPWAEIEPLIASLQSYDGPHGRVWCLLIRANREGRLLPFGKHTRLLLPGTTSKMARMGCM